MASAESDTMPFLEFPSEAEVANITSDGWELHSHVPPENWCVTVLDLDDFGERVRDLQHNSFFPDNSDRAEKLTMQVVYEHVVVPETRKIGGTSWALMLHPEGLPMGVYVSHSFQEGVYDFIRKVRLSMPRGESKIWSRFFSIPQCWGIDQVLGPCGNNPLANSPLAMAIAHTNSLLLVPNEEESLFCRSWCVLEVCIACEKEITLMPSVDMIQCPRRTSIGSASHAAAKVSDGLPSAITQLFKDFQSVSSATDCDIQVQTRIKDAINGKESWLDRELRSALLALL